MFENHFGQKKQTKRSITMGWTYNNLKRNRLTLDQAKQNHVREATLYSGGTIARIIMHEWHPKTWYAIIGLYAAQTDGKEQKPYQIFLRTDMIDATPAEFGYKDMTEEMGPYVEDRPSASMCAAIVKYIPKAEGYAKEFRDRMGIPYLSEIKAIGPASADARR
jgi:hypothetical protein